MSDPLQIEVRNDTRYRVDVAAVVALARGVLRAEGVTAAELGVGFIGELRMRSLNRVHLGADYVTDVLAFPLEEPDEATEAAAAGPAATSGDGEPVPRLLGDVVVCLKRAERQAAAGGLPLSLETAVLLVHGILHVLGHDHETDAGEMALRQAEILEALAWDDLMAVPPA
jgi:probable rRNA maturation factor